MSVLQTLGAKGAGIAVAAKLYMILRTSSELVTGAQERAMDDRDDDRSIDQARIDRIREEFISRRGWWGDAWEAVLSIDPEFIEKYGEWSHVPVKHGYLDPKVREFVWIAV